MVKQTQIQIVEAKGSSLVHPVLHYSTQLEQFYTSNIRIFQSCHGLSFGTLIPPSLTVTSSLKTNR